MTQTRAIYSSHSLLITFRSQDCEFFCGRMWKLYSWSTKQGPGQRMWVTFTRQLSRTDSDFKEEQERAVVATLVILCPGQSPPTATNPAGSVPKTPHQGGWSNLSHSISHWLRCRGVPTNSIKEEKNKAQRRKIHDGKNRCTATFLHPASGLRPRSVFTPMATLQ